MAQHWIVVGAGSAGCVLANRLSHDGTRHITLLDDGPDLAPPSVPAGIHGLNFFDALAEPGRIHNGLVASRTTGGKRSLYQRGRGLGGSSAVNAMVALHGSNGLYESWGWHDTADAWDRVQIPTEPASRGELGPVDRALLASDSRARLAQLTRRGPSRVTSAEAYVWPALDRSNLDIRPDAMVDIVLLDGRRAAGVELTDGTRMSADRVVLAAGAIHSPAILLRSGFDTPGIGCGLQDHPSAVFTLQLRAGVEQDQTGLAIGSVLHAVINDNTVQLLPMSHLGRQAETAGLGALMAALMTPKGRSGTVIVDRDGRPVIDFGLLDDPRDLSALTDASKLALDLLARPEFDAIVEQVFIDDVGTLASTLVSDDAIAGWLRRNCGDYVHASSTCAMGTVVDERAEVVGYDNVFVCDASIFPAIPDANTHFPTTMLAERMCAPGRLLG